MKKLSIRVEGTHGVCNGYPKALPGRERTQKKKLVPPQLDHTQSIKSTKGIESSSMNMLTHNTRFLRKKHCVN